MRRSLVGLLAIATLFLATACGDDATEPADQGRIALSLEPAGVTVVPESRLPETVSADRSFRVHRDVIISAINGVLRINRILLHATDLRLVQEADIGSCDGAGADACLPYDAGPQLVDLTLEDDEPRDTLDIRQVPLELFHGAEIEFDDLDASEEQEDDPSAIDSLLSEARAVFPNWPKGATMGITGTFTDPDGNEMPYTVFFNVELTSTLLLNDFVQVSETNPDPVLIVEVNPSPWFAFGDSVENLAEKDGQLLDFNQEFPDGITRIIEEDQRGTIEP